ncbi:MAG: ATP phosphoribosyltransferase [Puniceicoccaceae bacterium]
MDDQYVLNIGFPKGSLEESTIGLFRKAGYRVSKGSRSYRAMVDDPELGGVFVRAQEVSRYVEHGYFDCGLTGHDWVLENRSDVVEVCDLVYSRASSVRSRWVLAVPASSAIRTVADLEGKRIATEVVYLTETYLAKHGVKAEVEFSWGATEVKVPDLVDAIVDLTETGSSLRANNLRVVDTILYTNTKLIANRASWEDERKRQKIENLALLLTAALEAEGKVGLKLNLRRDHLEGLLEKLPSLRNPTINELADRDWVAVEVIVDETIVREIIPALKRAGAEGIIEYPLTKVIY